jgi:hypothetical protein
VIYYLEQYKVISLVQFCVLFSPLFDLDFILAFAHDNFNPKIHSSEHQMIKDMEKAYGALQKG